MIKSHIKYLITLCILLLSVSSQLDANTHRASVFHHTIKNHYISPNDNPGNLQSYLNATFSSASFNGSKNTFFACDEEVEEDKEGSIVSHKKNLESTNISSTPFYSWYSKFFLLNNTQSLHFGKHLSHFSYYKFFIVFQVFRI